MSDDADVQAVMARYEAVQAQLQAVDERLARMEAVLMEQRQAASTLEALEGGQEALVPVGAGFHVHARIQGDAPVVAPLGAGYATDATSGRARELLQQRMEETRAAMERTAQQATELARTLQSLGMRLQPQ